MKAEHRHELKTNILADWLGNFPEWVKDNVASVIVVVVVICAAVGFQIWRIHGKNAMAQEQERFTSIVNQVSNIKDQILRDQGQRADMSLLLLKPANALKDFADSTTDDNLAAMALIKRGEALRTELHYRTTTVSSQDLASQIGLARESYTKAMEKSSKNPSLLAAAKFGLGLCEEELGNFDRAREIYGEIAADAAFAGDVSVEQAKLRLETMADYGENVVFRPKPKPIPVKPPQPIRIGPVDVNWPADANAPAVVKVTAVDVNLPAKEPNSAVITPGTKPSAVEPNAALRMPDANSAPPDPNSTPQTTNTNVGRR